MKNLFLILVLVAINTIVFSQSVSDTILWQNPTIVNTDNNKIKHLNFTDAIFVKAGDIIPEYQKQIKLKFNSDVSLIKIENFEYLDLNTNEKSIVNVIYCKTDWTGIR